MRHIIASIGMALFTSMAHAQETCTLDNKFCVPIVGCIMDTGELVVGFSHGKTEGPIFANILSGSKCTGDWKRTSSGFGRASFTCEDGRSGRLTYTLFDQRTGTASGKGTLNNGQKIRFWSGHNFAAFLAKGSRKLRDFEHCTAAHKQVG